MKWKKVTKSWKTSCSENVGKLNSNLWQISRSFDKLLIGKSRQENVPPEDTLKAERDLNRQTRVHDSLEFSFIMSTFAKRNAKETLANNRKCHSRQSCLTWQRDKSELASHSDWTTKLAVEWGVYYPFRHFMLAKKHILLFRNGMQNIFHSDVHHKKRFLKLIIKINSNEHHHKKTFTLQWKS